MATDLICSRKADYFRLVFAAVLLKILTMCWLANIHRNILFAADSYY